MKIKTISGYDFEIDFDAEVNEFINRPDVLVKNVTFCSTSVAYNGNIVDRYIAHVYYKDVTLLK